MSMSDDSTFSIHEFCEADVIIQTLVTNSAQCIINNALLPWPRQGVVTEMLSLKYTFMWVILILSLMNGEWWTSMIYQKQQRWINVVIVVSESCPEKIRLEDRDYIIYLADVLETGTLFISSRLIKQEMLELSRDTFRAWSGKVSYIAKVWAKVRKRK